MLEKLLVKPLGQPLGNHIVPRILGNFYFGLVRLRNFLYDRVGVLSEDTGATVVSVGGIEAGGTGKTPLVRLIGEYFYRNGLQIVFVSRGYKRKSRGITIVKPGQAASWETVGDEPALLHSGLAQSWLAVNPDRVAAIRSIQTFCTSPALFILDDGFQHRRVRRTVDIVCVSNNLINDFPIPAGYLREPWFSLGRAHLVCIIGSEAEKNNCEKTLHYFKTIFPQKHIFILYQVCEGWINAVTGESRERPPHDHPVLISGIARPQRFVALVRSLNIAFTESISLPDHYEYSADEGFLNKTVGDGILTTEKDAVKLKRLKLVNCNDIWYLKLGLRHSNKETEKLFYTTLHRLTFSREALS